MRDAGVFVFDVPTAVVRPIQRCMKYPVFLGELLKLLPITHIDHPKLLEAKKQMENLVLKMNESKRRKELSKSTFLFPINHLNFSQEVPRRLSRQLYYWKTVQNQHAHVPEEK